MLVASDRFESAAPARPGTLIGRDALLADVRARLLNPEIRLLTLTGPGGSGKTRLSIDAAAAAEADFELGARFVDLTAVREPSLVLPTIGRSLGLAEADERHAVDAIAEYLGDRTLLVVLDNFEQVVEAAFDVAVLLARCAGLTALVTSRAALRIRWEHELPVPPLELPDLARLPPASELAATPAVALFAERARAVRPDLVLDADGWCAVAEICVRLDGLPLALELAAARIKLLPPAALLARLVRRIDVLGGAGRDLPERQRTLRSTMDWSYDLLTPEEQVGFRQLAVFDGGFALDDGDELLRPSVVSPLDCLGSLVDKSLLRPLHQGGEARVAMLETVRQYGLDRLLESGEEDVVRDRHAALFLHRAEAAVDGLGGKDQADGLARLEREHANFSSALEWTLGRGGSPLRLSAALWRFWEVRGHLREGRQWLKRALEADPGEVVGVRAEALVGAGTLASRQSDYAAAAELFEQALTLFRSIDDRRGEALVLQLLGVQAQMQSNFERAEVLLEAGLKLFRALGDARGLSTSLNNLGYMLWRQGQLDRAAVLHAESVALARQLQDMRLTAVPVYNLGVICRIRRDYRGAAERFGEALGLFRELGDKRWIAFSLSDLGDVAEREGDPARALQLEQEAIAHFAELGDRFGMALTCERLARVCAAQRGQAELALRLFAVADALRSAIGSPRPPGEEDDAADLAWLRRGLGETTFAATWSEARASGPEAAIRQVLSLDPVSLAASASTLPADASVSPLAADASVLLPAEAVPARAAARDASPLSAREGEVAILVARGMTNRQIGRALVLSERTVDAHVDHIRTKLNVRGRAQIAAWVTDRGLASS